MPRTTTLSPTLLTLLDGQDGIATVAQLADHGVGRGPISHRVSQGRWRWLLPGVLTTHSGYPTPRQRVVAAWLWAGPGSAVDGESACYWYGLGDRPPQRVHVVVPLASGVRTKAFVVVRRSLGDIPIGARSLVPYVDPATALVVAARSAGSERAAIAVLSRGLQTGLVTQHDLLTARLDIGDKWCARADRALAAVGVGIRSPAERDLRRVVLTSATLPEPLWNAWLDLGDGGGPVCADALWRRAGLVHEVNGRRYHAWGSQFEDMQARHDRMTAAGLVVMHNTPTRIARSPKAVLAELERAHSRYTGRGLPANVRLVDPPIARELP